MNPIEPPRYRRTPSGGDLQIDVTAADWPALLAAATLSLSDVVHPLGAFETWTARRMTAKGSGPSEVLEKWLHDVLEDHKRSGFLPALVEVEKAEPSRAVGIHRGGIEGSATTGTPTGRAFVLRAGKTSVAPAADGAPWEARFVVGSSP